MKAKLLIPKKVVTVNSNNEVFEQHAVEVTNGIITRIDKINNFKIADYEVLNYTNCVLIPGFVQTHIHLCQTLFRGFADDLELLDWLQKRIFPYENAHDKESLRVSSRLGINDLLTGGTTTLLDMGSLRHQEIIFEELASSGIRAVAGSCMIDQNMLFPSFCESIEWNLQASYDWAKAFHNSNNGKLKYGFAPRFVLSCTEKLLKETKEMMKDFPGSILHSHSSENKKEVDTVRAMTGKENVTYFDSIGLLDDHTVLAHCIHLNMEEIKTLKNRNVRVSHCPSSNLKLGSGIANIPHFIKDGIFVSLGADGAPCNNGLSAFTEMRHAALIQKPIHGPTSMDALSVFRIATIEGAKALHLDSEIGSIEVGKRADLVLLDLEKADQPLQIEEQQIYSSIVYSATKENIKAVYLEGELKVENGKSVIYDEEMLISNGKKEFQKMLRRVN